MAHLPHPTARRHIQTKLLSWFHDHKRDLPWRHTEDPYHIWISEVMLQQTQVDQVIPYYQRFLKQFPTVNKLANAKIKSVYKMWEGLGYYRRAGYIHTAAKIIEREFGSKIPNSYDALRKLPGFGDYTAGAVLSIAFNQNFPAVDGNVLRVLARVFRIETDITTGPTHRNIRELAAALIPSRQSGSFNEALIELGALVCTPKHPQCGQCPIKGACRAYQELPNPKALPVKRAKSARPHFHVAVGVVVKRGTYLVAKRPADVILGNLWEFPGSRIQDRESRETACKRYLRDNFGIQVEIIRKVLTHQHQFTHFRQTMHFYECQFLRGRLKSKEHTTAKWLRPKAFSGLAFSRANYEIIRGLKE